MIPATGVRITWADLPAPLRSAIERRLGSPVVEAVSQTGGFSPGTADRVVTAAGDRAFVKAVGAALNPQSVAMARTEARVTAALPPGTPAPRVIATVDQGDWVALVLQDVAGRHPRTPWVDDELDAAVSGLRELARTLTPAPVVGLPTAAAALGSDLAGWDRIADDPPADLDPWARAHLPALRAAGARATLSLTGDTLCHGDVRADNMLVRSDGSIVFVDWPWGCAGPAWLDTVLLALNVIVHGGDGQRVLAGVDPAVARDVLAGLAGYFLDQSRHPPQPGLPTVRAFQRAQGDALIPWLRAAVPKVGAGAHPGYRRATPDYPGQLPPPEERNVMIDQAEVRVLLLESIHADAVSRLGSEGFRVESERNALDEVELIDRVRGVHLLGIRSKTQVTAKVLEAADSLVAIGAFCIGTDQIDLAAASERGVAVFNAPFSNTRSVVELAISEIIAMTRRLTEKNALMHDGVWDKSADGAHEIRGRRLGIVGYGNIGTQLSVLAENLGMHVSFYDTADRLALSNAHRCGGLDELLATSDVVTLHVDGRPGNAGFFGAEQFARMRPGSLFLNLSRGIVVDHRALRDALAGGHLAGAAVDVFPSEPKGRGDEFVSELRGLPNVILTPHIGGSTEEAQSDIGDFVANKLTHFLREGNTTLSVNLPGVTLPEQPGMSRIVHVHVNTPGVLAQVNSILAEHHVNVEGQLLSTRGEYGYLITDISGGFTDAVLDRLRGMSQTVRLRVLS